MKTLVILYKICTEEQWFTHFEFIFHNETELEIVDKFVHFLPGWQKSLLFTYGVDNKKMSYASFKNNKGKILSAEFFIIEDIKTEIPLETKEFINKLADINFVN